MGRIYYNANPCCRHKFLTVCIIVAMVVIFNSFIALEDYSWITTSNLIMSSVQYNFQELEKENNILRRTYFLVETSNSTNLSPRQACAVESVARLHPNNTVKILHVGKEFNYAHPLSILLNDSYSNIVFEWAKLDDLLRDSPMEPWIQTRPWQKSPYNVSHLSDIMRSLLMWKWGGVYLDMDIVVLKPLNDLHNAIGLQSENYLAAGVLIFEKGHPLMNASVYELAHNYRSWSWGHHGPELYTRMIKHMCNVSNIKEFQKKPCLDVNILEPSAFYPIFYPAWRKYFNKDQAGDTIMQWMKSYTIHVWNKLAEKETVYIGSGQPYELAVKYFCPRVYSFVKPFKKM